MLPSLQHCFSPCAIVRILFPSGNTHPFVLCFGLAGPQGVQTKHSHNSHCCFDSLFPSPNTHLRHSSPSRPTIARLSEGMGGGLGPGVHMGTWEGKERGDGTEGIARREGEAGRVTNTTKGSNSTRARIIRGSFPS